MFTIQLTPFIDQDDRVLYMSNLMFSDDEGDSMVGGIGDDTLVGNGGNDTLVGAGGSDSLSGGDGDDLIVLDGSAGLSTIDGGDGIDMLDLRFLKFTGGAVGVTLNTSADKFGIATVNFPSGKFGTVRNIENFIGTAGDDLLHGYVLGGGLYDGGAGDDYVRSYAGSTLIGGTGNDVLDAYDGDNVLRGDAGDDHLWGSRGKNTLVGGTGNDYLWGWDADDLVIQDDLSSFDTIKGGGGWDIVDYTQTANSIGSIAVDLHTGKVTKYLAGRRVSGVDALSDIEDIVGTANGDSFIGNGLGDVLHGAGGDDSFAGGLGSDQFDGGTGIDRADYTGTELKAVRIVLDLQAGTVNKLGLLDSNTSLGSDFLRDVEQVTGTVNDDTLIGGSGNDDLAGAAGNDFFIGSGSNDRFDGGSGRDTLDYSQSVNLQIQADLAGGIVSKMRDGVLVGIDTLNNIEVLVGTANGDLMLGSAGNDTLYGNAGNDTLHSLGGNDFLSGGDGDDTLIKDVARGNDTFDGGSGVDIVDYSSPKVAMMKIRADLAAGTVNVFQSGMLRGTDLLRNVEVVIGSGGNDTIIGDAAANHLNGGDGNDFLGGGEGNDTLSGGLGSDSIAGGAGDDRFVQDRLAGNDTLDGGSGFNYVAYNDAPRPASYVDGINANLATGLVVKFDGIVVGIDTLRNIEALTGTISADTLTGSARADWLAGDAGSDLLDGGAGNDTLNGGAGMDTINGGDGDDTILQDTVNLADRIDGGAGVDTLDYRALGAGSFVKVDLRFANFLTIYKMAGEGIGFAGMDLVSGIERYIGSNGNDTMFDGIGNVVFNGGAGDDLISSIVGNATLEGGSGNDTLAGSGGAKTYVFAAGFGQDHLRNTNAAGEAGLDLVRFTDSAATAIGFARNGDALAITIAGTDDTLTIDDWFSASGDGTTHRVDRFMAGDVVLSGSVVTDHVGMTGVAPVSMSTLFGMAS